MESIRYDNAVMPDHVAAAILTLYFAAFLCGGFWEVIVSDKLTVKMFLILAAATWLGITALSYLMDTLRIRSEEHTSELQSP